MHFYFGLLLQGLCICGWLSFVFPCWFCVCCSSRAGLFYSLHVKWVCILILMVCGHCLFIYRATSFRSSVGHGHAFLLSCVSFMLLFVLWLHVVCVARSLAMNRYWPCNWIKQFSVWISACYHWVLCLLFELSGHLFASRCFVTFVVFVCLQVDQCCCRSCFCVLCFLGFCCCQFLSSMLLHCIFYSCLLWHWPWCLVVVWLLFVNWPFVSIFLFSFLLLRLAFVTVLLFIVWLVWIVACQKHEIAWTRQHQTSPWHCDARCTMCSSLAHDGHVRQGVHSLVKRHQNGPGCLSIWGASCCIIWAAC